MIKRFAWIAFGFKWLLLVVLDPLPASGNLVFSENFSSIFPGIDQHFAHSERWGHATEFWLEPVDQSGIWTFNESVVLSINPADGNKAVAPNEFPTHGEAMTTVPIPGFQIGQWYMISLEHWGDDRPDTHSYEVDIEIDSTVVGHLSRSYTVHDPLSPSFAIANIAFVATAISHSLTIRDVTNVGEASAIIDNITIVAIPEARPYLVMSAGTVLLALYGAATRLRAHRSTRGAA